MMLILDYLKEQSNINIVILPRENFQRVQFVEYKKRLNEIGEKFIIPERAIDTLSLLYYSDVMIGGGGTMNREAAALGVKTYSFFMGPTGDVDKYLQRTHRLQFIKSTRDIEKIILKKKLDYNHRIKSQNLKNIVTCQILEDLN